MGLSILMGASTVKLTFVILQLNLRKKADTGVTR